MRGSGAANSAGWFGLPCAGHAILHVAVLVVVVAVVVGVTKQQPITKYEK